mmetsp:Transcript_43983/g.64632  ORF Transcript_43983/g.64632 Transcript_43983/m.64632 type:complete len:553 (+) Transcript_43983:102-1760(+)
MIVRSLIVLCVVLLLLLTVLQHHFLVKRSLSADEYQAPIILKTPNRDSTVARGSQGNKDRLGSKTNDKDILEADVSTPKAGLQRSYLKQLSQPLGGNKENTRNTVVYSGKNCECELVSVDCLDAIRCLPGTKAPQVMALGVMTRQVIKEVAKFSGRTSSNKGFYPVGKGLQYSSIMSWLGWIRRNELPIGMQPQSSPFVNEARYPFCIEKALTGKACFLDEYNTTEDLGDLEEAAIENESTKKVPSNAKRELGWDVVEFLRIARKKESQNDLPALGHLLSFAHIARIQFARTPPLVEIYKKFKRSVIHNNALASAPDSPDQRLKVSMHMRRGDSCGHKKHGYETKPSMLDSVNQNSAFRMCYNTSVYIDALKRVQTISGKQLDVYLATDHAGSIMEELEKNFPVEYKAWNWHYLDFSRDAFDYQRMIEVADREKQELLGETAFADIWHLSHGQVFVGHLGSRFGKVSWLLQMARWNTFVPFFTVDGHSFCCEIDEQCANAKPWVVDMENCLTFAHEIFYDPSSQGGKKHENYWEDGSKLRQVFVEKKLKMGF